MLTCGMSGKAKRRKKKKTKKRMKNERKKEREDEEERQKNKKMGYQKSNIERVILVFIRQNLSTHCVVCLIILGSV